MLLSPVESAVESGRVIPVEVFEFGLLLLADGGRLGIVIDYALTNDYVFLE